MRSTTIWGAPTSRPTGSSASHFCHTFAPTPIRCARISFMNRESRHVAELLLYYPQTSVWGQSSPAFRTEGSPDITNSANWSQDAAETNSSYAQLKLRLTEENLDFKVADDAYLAASHMEGKQFAISTSRFTALVLPPISTVRLHTAERVREFYGAGGRVIAIGRLPFISVENGRRTHS